MRLDIADLQLFLNIVDAGSITAGAESAHLALASASERLRRMESDAGIALLQRGSRGVTTTAAGDALANHARRILRQQAAMRSELQRLATGDHTTLRLQANTAALAEYLPRPLATWLARNPLVHIDLIERTSADIVRSVRAGLAEAGVVSDAVASAGVSLQPVYRSDLVLIVPSEHHLDGSRHVRLADVAGESFVGMAAGNALQDYLNEKATAAGHSLSLRVRMTTFDGLCDMVTHGIGVGVVPRAIAQRNRRTQRYRIIALADDWARRQLSLCFGDWAALSSPMQNLLQHLGASQ